MKNFVIIYWVSILLSACGNNDIAEQEGPETLIELELVDSLVVNELNTLTINDYSPDKGNFLITGTKTKKLYLVDEKGIINKEYDILNEGPNGVGSGGAFGYRFLDGNTWVAQGLYNGYHIFDLEGKKISKVPHNTVGLFYLSINHLRTTFTPYRKGGHAYIVGEEPNSFNPAELNADKLGAGFYQQARIIYNYNLDTEENQLLETYPADWEPRKNNRYVGTSYPFVAYSQKQQELALLPEMGNQLFVYNYSDSLPILKHTVNLAHPLRPKEVPLKPKVDQSFSDYPRFTDIRMLGDYILVGFHTRIPEHIMRELRAESEQYASLPATKAAHDKYYKPYYLLVKDGKQVGILDAFPVHGSLNFTDQEGFLYINDNIFPEVERDYNIFYKLRLKD